jgi:hypothetical protein
MGKILKTQEPDWLLAFADRMACHPVRIAMRSDDLNALTLWNSKQGHEQADLNELRVLLGKISTDLNSVSEIYNYGSRKPGPQYAQRAAQVLPDLANIDGLKTALQQTQGVLTQTFPNLPATQMLNHLIHSIQQVQVNPQQYQALSNIANAQNQQRQGFRDEADPGQLRNFLKQSVYGKENATTVALRVIREALQNATDAVIHRGNKVRDPNHAPSINLQTHYFDQGDAKMMDLMFIDNGIGMDWSVLSQKFFEYFESGKGDQGGESAGGFGIAKALIQETPQHGWSVETNGIHSSRFGRNMYFGTPTNEQYQPPKSAIQQTPNGTVLTLYGIPEPPQDYNIRTLCQNYAIGQVQILVNGVAIEPRFKLSELKKLGPNMEGLAASIADNPTEAEICKLVASQALEKNKDEFLGDIHFDPAEGKSVNIEFALTRNRYTGQVFVLLNGQYQFNYNEYLNKCDLIINIGTNLTPKDQGYPVDPGRENLTEPYRDAARKTIDFVKKTVSDISEHALFKEGLNIKNFNNNFKPMQTSEGEDDEVDPNRKAIEDQFSAMIGAHLGETFTATASPQEAAEQIAAMASRLALSPEQQGILNTATEALMNDGRKNVDVKTEIEKIIDGLTTPAAVIVQKNFISDQALDKNPEVNRNILMLWQKIIRLVTKTATKHLRHARRSTKQFVPGVVYSDECLALYQPANPKFNQPFDVVAINPMTVAAIMEPELFQKAITGDNDNDSSPASHGMVASEQFGTQDMLINMLMHEAIHEVTHLLFPDGWSYTEFHRNVTKIELACHFLEPEIRKEVRSHIRGMREDMKKLIRIVGKDKKKFLNAWILKNCKFAQSKTLMVPIGKLYSWSPKVEETIKDIKEGRISQSSGAVVVSKLDSIKSGWFIVDGHHRAIEALLRGETSINCVQDPNVPFIERPAEAYASYVADMVQLIRYSKPEKIAAQVNDMRQIDYFKIEPKKRNPEQNYLNYGHEGNNGDAMWAWIKGKLIVKDISSMPFTEAVHEKQFDGPLKYYSGRYDAETRIVTLIHSRDLPDPPSALMSALHSYFNPSAINMYS